MRQFIKISVSKYLDLFYDEEKLGFQAEIRMNPRDAMVFVYITALPEVNMIKDFIEYVLKHYGGKCSIQVAANLLPLVPNIISPKNDADIRFIDRNKLTITIDKLRIKDKVMTNLDNFATKHYLFLAKQDLLTRAKQLSAFKIYHAPFVNAEKINNGQYSEYAEIEKLNNPNVEQFAIEQQGKIIASVMYYIHNNMIYASDFIIHSKYRNKGLAQTLIVKSYDEINSNHHQLSGAWFIAGGDSTSSISRHLYNELLSSLSLANRKQNKLGLYICFRSPGPALLEAANRELDAKGSFDEERYIEDALMILDQSQQSKCLRFGVKLGVATFSLFWTGMLAYQFFQGNSDEDINKPRSRL